MDRRRFLVSSLLLGAGGVAGGALVDASGRSRRAAAGPPPPFATAYYVDSETGSDQNDGTAPDRAWQSLGRVNQEVFTPGDRLLFKAGTRYQGQLKPRGSGAVVAGEPQPIVIDCFGEGPRPHVAGEGKVQAALHLYNAEYWEVNRLAFSNEGAARESGRRGVHVQVEDFGTAHHIHLKNLHIHDVNGSLVKDEGGGGGILWENGGEQKKSRFDGLLIEGCHLERCTRNGMNSSGYASRSAWHPNLNVVVRGNLIEEVPGDGIVPIGCDGALIEHNVMRNCPRLLPDGEAAAGIWPWSSDNTVVQFNEVSGHKAPWDAQGFDADWNCRGTLIQYNYSHDNEGGFLLVCNNGDAGRPFSLGNIGTVVRYNISINDGLHRPPTDRNGLFSPIFHISGPVEDTLLHNNLIAATERPGKGGDNTILQMDNWGGPWPQNTRFMNNIFYVEGASECDWDYGEATGTAFESNLYFGNYENAPYEQFPGETQAIRKRPHFMDVPYSAPDGIDNLAGYQLRPGSPAIGSGTAIPDSGGRDFWGNAVPQEGEGVDIGPHELSAS